jgi:hypothetical protein
VLVKGNNIFQYVEKASCCSIGTETAATVYTDFYRRVPTRVNKVTVNLKLPINRVFSLQISFNQKAAAIDNSVK